MLRKVREKYGDRLKVSWHAFPLEQVNSVQGPEWKLWEQPDEYRSKGLWAFRAAEAARLQGPEPFERFHYALLEARHADKKDVADRSVLLEVARQSGLDVARFERDLADRGLLARVAEDYKLGVEEHGVWGTPTFVFEGGQAAYLRVRPAPPDEEAVRLFEELAGVIRDRPYVLEIKRPR